MKFLTVEMDNFIKERVLYEVKVNKLSPADAHDKANKALKSLILEQYEAETKALYMKEYGLPLDMAYQAAMTECNIKIETYFDTEDPEYDSKIKLLQRMCSRFFEDLATTPKQIVLELEQDFGFIDLKNGEIVSLYFVARTQMTDLILPFKKRHDLFESLFYCQELLEEVRITNMIRFRNVQFIVDTILKK